MLDYKKRQRLAIIAKQLCIGSEDLEIIIKRHTRLNAQEFRDGATEEEYQTVIKYLTTKSEYISIFKMRGKIRAIARVLGWSEDDLNKFCNDSNKLPKGVDNYAKLDWYNYKELNKLVTQFEKIRDNTHNQTVKQKWKYKRNPQND